MITKDMIMQRKEQLEKDRDTLIANYNAVLGALQDCDYWLQQIDRDPGGVKTARPARGEGES